MRLLVACPVVQAPGKIPGRLTWDRELLVIDNTERHAWLSTCAEQGWPRVAVGCNLGVSTSWNLAIAYARALDPQPEYVALISSSIEWHQGLSQLDRILDLADPERGLLTDQAFHATIWPLRIFDRLGTFDENFWPGYFEDNDWLRRLECTGLHIGANPMPKAELDVACENAVTLHSGAIGQLDLSWPIRYYAHKWGGPPGQEQLCEPFGLGLPISWWPVLHARPTWAGGMVASRRRRRESG